MKGQIPLDTFWPGFDRCHRLWLGERGTFGPDCVGILAYIPALVAVVILIARYGLQPLWRRRPQWLRVFAPEEQPATHDGEASPRSPRKDRSYGFSTVLLFAFSLLGVMAAVLFAIFFSPIYGTALIPSLISCIIIAIDRPRTTPGALFIIYVVLLLDQVAIFVALPGLVYGRRILIWSAAMVGPVASLIIILFMPMRESDFGSEDIAKVGSTPTYDLRSPEDNFTLWQWMTVSWMSPLIAIGYRRQMHDEDVWLLPYQFQHGRLHLLFRELKGSVIGRLLKANGPDLFIMTFLGILESGMSLVQVIFLQQLLAAIQSEPPQPKVAVVYAALILFARLIAAQSGVFSLWFQRRCYERARGEMITMVYEKTLRRKAFTIPSAHKSKEPQNAVDDGESEESLDGIQEDSSSTLEDEFSVEQQHSSVLGRLASLFGFNGLKSKNYTKISPNKKRPDAPSSTGKILNLMRADVYEVAQRFWEFASIFTKPLNFLLSLGLIWHILGSASLLGILVLLTAQVFNLLLIRLLISWERSRRSVTDAKLQLTTQFVEALRHLRWYAWTDAWLQQILEKRQTELRYRVITNILQKSIAAVNLLATYMFPVAAFIAYTVVEKRQLTVDVAFPALNLFAMLDSNLRDLPQLIAVLLNAMVAMGRIEGFMAEPDKEDGSGRDIFGPSAPLGPLEMDMTSASFSWPGSRKLVLKDVSFSCSAGLTLICGKVGTGKTALLQAILGEMDQFGGERKVPEEIIGYCAQSPWLQSMSIRENILFSAQYDERRYKQVLEACCLLPDLSNFKAGDLYNVGENGVGLSGGQKARVALARAVYSRARILLLDDPIAALDHQTAETILRRLFGGASTLMQGRMVLFVSHRVDLFTRYVDQALELQDGGRVRTLQDEDLKEHFGELLQRVTSNDTATEEDEEFPEDSGAIPDKFIEEETRAHGSVMASVYWRYVKAGKLWLWVFLIAFFVLFRAANIGYYWFLKVWGEAYEKPDAAMALKSQSYALHLNDPSRHLILADLHVPQHHTSGWMPGGENFGLPAPGNDVMPWLFWFGMISLVQVISSTLSDVTLIAVMYTAGKQLFADVMRAVSRATFRFYDVTPVGRLMNRMTGDIYTIDGAIANMLIAVVWQAISWASAIVVIAAQTPLFLVLTLVMTLTFVLVFARFLPASQSLRRLEFVSLSPLMSNFGTLLDGLTTVRAFRAQPHFQQRIVATTDNFQKMDHFYWSLQAWLAYRFDLLSAFSTFALTLTALNSGLSSGAVAFVLAAAANFVETTHKLCRGYGELQMMFVSVERVIELLDVEQEDDGNKAICDPPEKWPSAGDDIVFDDVTLRYAPHLDPSLSEVSFRIPAGSTVAVTGRTGSGKSTLALSLLGTVLPDAVGGGHIRIGDVDVAGVDKDALRRRVTFVAQDPVLFPGTLRANLDPLEEHSDEECAAVLARVLGHRATEEGGSLGQHQHQQRSELTIHSRVDGGGKNLSHGQRQLVGLGRAVLRRSPIIILDEATASIDLRTAFYIQEVLREELRHSTVITIAHRVEAVKDADYSLVLDKGRVVSCGPTRKD